MAFPFDDEQEEKTLKLDVPSFEGPAVPMEENPEAGLTGEISSPARVANEDAVVSGFNQNKAAIQALLAGFDKTKQAKPELSDEESRLMQGRAMDKLFQAGATAVGGKIDSNAGFYDDQIKLLNDGGKKEKDKKIELYKQLLSAQKQEHDYLKNAPKRAFDTASSSESKFGQALFVKQYPDLAKAFIETGGKIEDLSANALKQMTALAGAGANAEYILTTLRNSQDGKNYVHPFNKSTKQLGEALGQAGTSYGFGVDPRTQERTLDDRSGGSVTPITAPSVNARSLQEEKRGLQPHEVVNALPPLKYKEVQSAIKSFGDETKADRATMTELKTIADTMIAEARTNTNAAKQLGALVAKTMQGNKLTDKDVEIYAGQQGVVNKMKNFANKNWNGTITDGEARELAQTLKVYTIGLRASLEKKANQKSEVLMQGIDPATGVTPEVLKPLFYGQPQKAAPKSADITSSDMVKVISPDGKTGSIPKANLEKALSKGFKQVK